MTLRYPLDLPEDYVILRPMKYNVRTRDQSANAFSKPAGTPAGEPILLPVPELPRLASTQVYGNLHGAFNSAVATGLAEGYDAIVESMETGTTANVDDIATRLSNQIFNSGGPALKEKAAELAGKVVGIRSGEFQTLATGEISNPLIELLYSSPTLRQFTMSWSFAPKNENEAKSVHKIVNAMKKHHLPRKGSGDGMLAVPDVWMINLMIGGKEAEWYQKYFTSALETISVQQNSAGTHITLPGGQPVISNITTIWREMRTLTAEDYEDGSI